MISELDCLSIFNSISTLSSSIYTLFSTNLIWLTSSHTHTHSFLGFHDNSLLICPILQLLMVHLGFPCYPPTNPEGSSPRHHAHLHLPWSPMLSIYVLTPLKRSFLPRVPSSASPSSRRLVLSPPPGPTPEV